MSGIFRGKIDSGASTPLSVILERAGIRQNELAERLGVSPETISRILNGKAKLSNFVISQILRAFPQYRAEWLHGKDEFPTEAEAEDAVKRKSHVTANSVCALLSKTGWFVDELDDEDCFQLAHYDATGNLDKSFDLSPVEFHLFCEDVRECVGRKAEFLYQLKNPAEQAIGGEK